MTLRPSLQPPQPADGGPPVPRPAGAARRRRDRAAPTALAVIAEAAWVAVVAGLLQAFTRHPPVLGYAWYLAAAWAGSSPRASSSRGPATSWPAVVAALAIATGTVGLAPGAGGPGDPRRRRDRRHRRRRSSRTSAAGCSPSRSSAGVPYARLPADPRPIGNVLGLAVPGLAAVAIIGGMVGDRSAAPSSTRRRARWSCSSSPRSPRSPLSRLGLVAPAPARRLAPQPRVARALRPLLLAGHGDVAVATSLFAGRADRDAPDRVHPVAAHLGFFVGFDRRSIGILLLASSGRPAVAAVLQVLAASNTTPPPGPRGPGAPLPPDESAAVPVAFGVLGHPARSSPSSRSSCSRGCGCGARDDGEDASPRDARDRPRRPRRPAARGRRRRGAASCAGRRRAMPRRLPELLEDLDAHPACGGRTARRRPSTPAGCATRGTAALGLELLAADYGLVRFGGGPACRTRRSAGRCDGPRSCAGSSRVSAGLDDAAPCRSGRPAGEDAAPGTGRAQGSASASAPVGQRGSRCRSGTVGR